MKYSRLQVFDPPMCCSSGVCGPNVEPKLVRFSRDLDWVRQQGVEVERYNLSSHPAAFAGQGAVREALTKEGNGCLPLILGDGSIVSRGVYPSRSELMEFARIGAVAKEEQPEDASTAASKNGPKSPTTLCGPRCDCRVAGLNPPLAQRSGKPKHHGENEDSGEHKTHPSSEKNRPSP